MSDDKIGNKTGPEGLSETDKGYYEDLYNDLPKEVVDILMQTHPLMGKNDDLEATAYRARRPQRREDVEEVKEARMQQVGNEINEVSRAPQQEGDPTRYVSRRARNAESAHTSAPKGNTMNQDDYERFLARNNHAGEEMAHGMCNNNYFYRPFHLEEKYTATNWATREMCEMIMRKDPTRPAFWYLSYAAPHPPLVPPKEYLEMYDQMEFSKPLEGEWTKEDPEKLPFAYQYYKNLYNWFDKNNRIDIAKKAYYATCTYIDHQLRLVIGTLREQGLLEDTIILFTADHGEMLGTHGLFGKFLMYENSVKIPFILSPPASCGMVCNRVDDRIVELRDVMPTLLTLAGLKVPDYVEGTSLTEPDHREYTYGELWEDDRATRMIRTKTRKLIYYPVGNIFQLFDLEKDPNELKDVSGDPAYTDCLNDLKSKLIKKLYGSDLSLIKDGKLEGLSQKKYDFSASLQDGNKLFQGRDMLLQRGYR